jgi:hypothetical protein
LARCSPDRPDENTGNDTKCPCTERNAVGSQAMTVRVLIVDDDRDIEVMFRRQSKHGMQQRLLDFIRSATAALK